MAGVRRHRGRAEGPFRSARCVRLTPVRISGPADPRIAAYRDIADHNRLKARGLFVAEGRLVVRRAIEANAAGVRSVLVNDAGYRNLERRLAVLADAVPVFICDTGDFLGITGHDIHRGCLALVERPPVRPVAEVLEHAGRAAGESPVTLVVLEGVTDPDNVGGVFRNAAAFGVAGVLLDPASADPWYRKAIRTSMAAVLRMPFARFTSWPGGLEALRAAGFAIAALTPREPAMTLEAFAPSRPLRVALLVGTEGTGLTADAEAAADCRVRIPIAADVDSLNLAVAVGIALHRLTT